jgi:hypothetical protein
MMNRSRTGLLSIALCIVTATASVVYSQNPAITINVDAGANVRTFANTGLARSTTYTYRVRAYAGSSNSAYSNTASARTPRR